MRATRRFEWPTVLLLIATYAAWMTGLTTASAWFLPLGMILVTLAGALHSSLTHEVLHGHPFRNKILNGALVFLPLTLFIPYLRFKDTHLAHHLDSRLTDPYDDPESNYLDPSVWDRLSKPVQTVLMVNNSLAGRMILGPAIAQWVFMRADWRLIRAGDRRVALGWVLHVAGLIPVLWIVQTYGQMPWWAFLISSYAALSILKIRTFLEHQAHDRPRGRTVIIEDRGLLAFLFLNNNFHVVHHMHPKLPWYKLPGLYFQHRDRYLRCNDGYMYKSYGQILRKHLWRAKDPVPHPLWSRDQS